MSNQIDITLAANSQGAEQALQRVTKENERLEKQMEKLAEKSQKGSRDSIAGLSKLDRELKNVGKGAEWATNKASSGFEKSVGSAKRFAMELAGIGSAVAVIGKGIQLAVAEFDNLAKRQELKRLSAMGPAQAIREAKLAIEDDATISSGNIEQVLGQLAKETRADIATTAAAFGHASSAKGSLSNRDVLEAVRQALRIDPSNPEQAGVLSSRFLDVAKFSGTTDMRVNAGFLQNLGGASHVKNFEMIGQNLVPAINSMTAFGDSQEQAGELVSAMTQLLGEDEGRISATASLQLGSQLKDFFLKRATKGKMKGQLVGSDAEGEFAVPDAQFAAFRAAGSTQSRMDVMRQSPELARAFIGASSFETKAKEAVIGLVKGSETAMKELTQAQKVIRGTQSAEDRSFQAALFEKKIAEYESGNAQRVLTAEQQSASNLQNVDLNDQAGITTGIARKILRDTFEGTDKSAGINMPGFDSISKFFSMDSWGLGTGFGGAVAGGADPTQAAVRVLQKAKADLSGVDFHGAWVPNANVDQGDIQKIDEQIGTLRDQTRPVTSGLAAPPGAVRSGGGSDPQMNEQTKVLQQQTQILQSIDGKLSQNNGGFWSNYMPAAARVSRQFRELGQ